MQFGISYISALLKKHGNSTKLLVTSKIAGGKNKKIIDKAIKKFFPELICFTSVSTEIRFISDIAKYIKKHYPHIYLLIGGPHASLNPDETINESFDMLCIGEGEYPALELARQLENGEDPSGIQNLWIKKGSRIEKNPQRPFLKNLESLPFPDREMWKEWTDEDIDARLPVLLGRGCPFQCTYCCNHALKNIAEGTYVRFRTPENIIQEIRGLALQYPGKEDFYLEVETIGTSKKWVLELCSGLQELIRTVGRPLYFGTNLRVTPNADFEAIFEAFQKSNFRFINIGLESGSEKVRREILKRYYSNEDIIKTVRLARKYGLKICFYNMIGLPGETMSDFQETVKINRECLPDWHYTSIFYPYPGTHLYEVCKNQGLLEKLPPEHLMERNKAALDLPGFPRKQVQKSFSWFDYYVYKGKRPLPLVLTKVMISVIRSNSYLNYLFERITGAGLIKYFRYVLKQKYKHQPVK
jgi:radical SAM superfamily enzyme YgiQ (UPF0313 family)